MIIESKNPKGYLSKELLKIFGDNLVSIVIFGSYARKNYSENSDLDVMVVVEKERNESVLELRKNYLLKFKKVLDLHIFTKRDTINNFSKFSPLFSTLLLGKITLFDKEMFFENIFRGFIKKMVNQDIKYCEGGKIWQLNRVAESLEISQ